MLTDFQAREIVRDSIGKAVGKGFAGIVQAGQTLAEAGISTEKLDNLIITLASDPKNGVARFQHYIDPNKIAELAPQDTIGHLTQEVLRLSAGKLCSNPKTPHPQACCPYPPKCPRCGYPVL